MPKRKFVLSPSPISMEKIAAAESQQSFYAFISFYPT